MQFHTLITILTVVFILTLVLRLFFWLLGLLSWLLVPLLFFWLISRLLNFIRHGSDKNNNTSDNTSDGRWHRTTWTSGNGTWYTGWHTGTGSGAGSRNYNSGGYGGYSNSGNAGGTGTMTREQALSIFNLPSTASKDDIKKRYRDYVKKYHPDRLGSDATPETRKAAEDYFAKINAAHDLLTH